MQLFKRKPKDKINKDISILADIILKQLDDIKEKLDFLLERGSIDTTEGDQGSRGRIIKLKR